MPSAVWAVTATFGPAWSRALCDGCVGINVPPEWPLSVIALESGFDPLAVSPAGARGLWQKMPSKPGAPYTTTDPVQQIRDAFAFWTLMKVHFRVPRFTSREAFYCLNLAPARLRDGAYDSETVLYAAPGAAYQMNAPAFGLDPRAKDGAIRIRHLAAGLEAAIRRCRARYDAELEAAMVANVSGRSPLSGP